MAHAAQQPSKLLRAMANRTLTLLGDDWAMATASTHYTTIDKDDHSFFFMMCDKERAGMFGKEMERIEAFATIADGILYTCTHNDCPAVCVSVLE